MKSAMKIAAAAILALAIPMSAFAAEEMTKGEVTKIDPSSGKLTIKHEPIKKFDMDSMTMVWRAGDPAALKEVKPGDKIIFHADKVNGQFTANKIEKIKK
jgi:Cu(I)/Ag(I) efflux system periplasmic protein CusF